MSPSTAGDVFQHLLGPVDSPESLRHRRRCRLVLGPHRQERRGIHGDRGGLCGHRASLRRRRVLSHRASERAEHLSTLLLPCARLGWRHGRRADGRIGEVDARIAAPGYGRLHDGASRQCLGHFLRKPLRPGQVGRLPPDCAELHPAGNGRHNRRESSARKATRRPDVSTSTWRIASWPATAFSRRARIRKPSATPPRARFRPTFSSSSRCPRDSSGWGFGRWNCSIALHRRSSQGVYVKPLNAPGFAIPGLPSCNRARFVLCATHFRGARPLETVAPIDTIWWRRIIPVIDASTSHPRSRLTAHSSHPTTRTGSTKMPALLMFGWFRRKEQRPPSSVAGNLNRSRQKPVVLQCLLATKKLARLLPCNLHNSSCASAVVDNWDRTTARYANLRLVGSHGRKRRNHPAGRRGLVAANIRQCEAKLPPHHTSAASASAACFTKLAARLSFRNGCINRSRSQ